MLVGSAESVLSTQPRARFESASRLQPECRLDRVVGRRQLGAEVDRVTDEIRTRSLRSGLSWSERERHRAVDDPLAVDARDALQQPHAAPQTQHDRLDFHDVAWVDRPPVADPLDAGEE